MKITITEEKKDKLSEYTEKILRYAGKMMSCVESLDDDDEYGERGAGGSMGMRDDDDDDDMSMRRYGQRRGVRGTGPYSRYR